jgi:hypothetical protein
LLAARLKAFLDQVSASNPEVSCIQNVLSDLKIRAKAEMCFQ